ncbi:MAG: phosphatase PAP2 family protein [Ignavibacteriaceae bacterium]|nr:phosphatase PAP2 family protein [Ignavibacteriaceae bacterium]
MITILINKHWKISAHAMGSAGPLAAITFCLGPQMLFFSFITFLVGWSRVQLKVHTIAQVIGGILFAFISTYLQMYFIVRLFE